MLNDLIKEVNNLTDEVTDFENSEAVLASDINRLVLEMTETAKSIGIDIQELDYVRVSDVIELEELTNEALGFEFEKTKAFPECNSTDYIIAAIAGLIAVVIDCFLVGTPEVVKIYHGGENFDGSVLTELLRKIDPESDGKYAAVLKWLSDKCKVPYDISAEADVVIPNNHRLRGLAHDPFLGLFFAIADIIMGTTTTINNQGQLTVIINGETSEVEKLLSVLYFVGHIISDMFTARGVPVPGFFLTQFFTAGKDGKSLAKIAESMYLDGYDLRHLGSMSVPVAVKNLILNMYLRLTVEEEYGMRAVADKERAEIEGALKKFKLRFIADAVAAGGNFTKFLAPPNCGNPCALNVAEWSQFIMSAINKVRGATRDRSVENILDNRDVINRKWDELLQS